MLRKSFCLLFLLIASHAMTALAAERFEAFTQDRLQDLQAEGRPVLVEVYADWCSTCRRQAPILDALLAEEAFADLVALKLDWDAQRDHARELDAPRQSTLILFVGKQRVGTSVAETDPQRLRDFLALIQTTTGG